MNNAIALGYRTVISRMTALLDRLDRRDTLVPASYLSIVSHVGRSICS